MSTINCLCKRNQAGCKPCLSNAGQKSYLHSCDVYYGMYLMNTKIWNKFFGSQWAVFDRKIKWGWCYDWLLQFVGKVDDDTVRIILFSLTRAERPSLKMLLDSKLLREDMG